MMMKRSYTYQLIWTRRGAVALINGKLFEPVTGGVVITPQDRSYKRFISNKRYGADYY